MILAHNRVHRYSPKDCAANPAQDERNSLLISALGELTGIPAVFSLTYSLRAALHLSPWRYHSLIAWERMAMFVETERLHSGANQSHRAAEYARDGADRLSRGPLSSDMFGDFGAADVYYEAVSSSHTRHVERLQAHGQMLAGVGHKAHQAAAEFTAMDEHNAAKLRVVQCNSDT